jgi:hypothetical protein
MRWAQPGQGPAHQQKRKKIRLEKRDEASNLSTGTPGGLRQNRADHLTGQIPGGGLNAQPGLGGLGFQFGLGLAHLWPGSLAGGVQRGVALGVPLLHALLADLVDLGARLAQLGGILGRPGFGFGNGLLRIFNGAFGAGAALFQRGVSGPCTRNW